MKKGYFFLLDGIFAIVILVIGFLVVSTTRPDKEQSVPVEFVAETFVDILSTTKISDLCDINCKCSNPSLQQHCTLTNNYDQTIIDFLGELYSDGTPAKRNAAENIFSGFRYLIREDLYGVELKINNELIYEEQKKEASKELITNKKITFGFAEVPNTGTVRYWGPYLAEVNVWEK